MNLYGDALGSDWLIVGTLSQEGSTLAWFRADGSAYKIVGPNEEFQAGVIHASGRYCICLCKYIHVATTGL